MQILKGQVALVTGSTKGLGKGIALALAKKGAKVIVNEPPGETDSPDILKEIKSIGEEAVIIRADVSRNEHVQNMFKQIKELYGRLDILINNAGTSQPKNIFEIDEVDWHRIININLSSGFYCSKLAMELMKEQRYGRIVFISSVVAHRGAIFGHAHYAASKSGQLGLVKTLAATGAPLGINVNAIAPGIMATDLLFKTHGKEGVAELEKMIPLGLGKAEDIGNAAAFLCSQDARYITGATIDVNGGVYLR